ncbi:MAG: hypothetical protein WBQ26_00660 [Gemmatimonadaceae bacterium]|nr:hypothetical protein [Gemmatimonadaceae bacterium]
MTARQAWRRGAVIVAAVFAVAAAACFRKGKGVEPARQPVVLVVNNRGFFDVDVYALSSSGASAARLATVTGFSVARLVVQPNLLQPGGVLQVRLHPIGTLVTWVSPSLQLSDGEHAQLDVYSDANGNLSQSVLYPLTDSTSAPPLR